jgi:hypothetical protein
VVVIADDVSIVELPVDPPRVLPVDVPMLPTGVVIDVEPSDGVVIVEFPGELSLLSLPQAIKKLDAATAVAATTSRLRRMVGVSFRSMSRRDPSVPTIPRGQTRHVTRQGAPKWMLTAVTPVTKTATLITVLTKSVQDS